jgi:hypothetical protein
MRCVDTSEGTPTTRYLLTNAITDGIGQWSGADYADNLIKTVTGGISSTAAMGAGVTESQFTSKL